VDPLGGERRDCPGADEHLASAVDDDTQRALWFVLVRPRTGDRLCKVDLVGGDVDPGPAGGFGAQSDGAISGSAKTTRGMPS
jgi:hypothetical protein